MSFLNKVSGLKNKMTDKIATSSLGLTKIIKEFKDYRNYIERFSEENQKYAEFFKTYAEEESVEKITVPFAEKLEKIDIIRKELIESLNTECIAPLEEVVNDWLELQEMTKDLEKTKKEHEKDKKSLERAKSKFQKLESAEEKDEEKLAELDEEVNEAAKKVGESFDLVKSKEEGLEKINKKYEEKKLKTLKDVFKNHADLQSKFYKNAAGILSSTSSTSSSASKPKKTTTKKASTKKTTTKKKKTSKKTTKKK
ncbi:MAG: hypothetical protein ACTSXY_17110 [Promethearchaeota archaeon]